MVKRLKLNRVIRTMVMSAILVVSLCVPALAVGAIGGSSASTTGDASRDALVAEITGKVANEAYQTTKGGYYNGSAVVNDKTGLVNEKAFADLTSSAKRKLLEDMTTAVNDKIAEDSKVVGGVAANTGASAVSDDTKSTWLAELQQTNGIGSQLMNNILSQTKPDFVKANKIYTPFAGPLGVVLGLLCILIGAGVTISMALDLAWMAIPIFRGFTQGEDGKADRPKYISFEAYSAMKDAEEGSDKGKGGNKVAVFIYFKKRVAMLIVLGVCLLYLVQGEIFTLVSWILDLVSGMIGF